VAEAARQPAPDYGRTHKENTMPMEHLSTASRSILRVGGGRGFLVEKSGERFVITAAHCLTAPITVYGDTASNGATLPPAHGGTSWDERTY
jgi:hypothetical protein